MKKMIKQTVYFLIVLAAFESCKKPKDDVQQPTNIWPVANAGADQIIILPANSILLNGTGTDADGLVVRYDWRYVSGPSTFTIKNTDKAQATVNNMARGIYEFELRVTDNKMLFSKDKTIVFVLDSLNDPINDECRGCWD